ncbi:MAG: hypothetical protein KA436_11965 [Oligoflexales bacterium]|nr:hypothetical protein [Oligoflexales bacterium]
MLTILIKSHSTDALDKITNRRGIIPGKTLAEIKQEKEEKNDEKKIDKGSWSRLLSRVFGIDVSTCRVCGGEMRIIASIIEREAVQKILTHLGLSPRPPPIAPSRIQHCL